MATSSASSRSERDVNTARSQKRTVTIRRSSSPCSGDPLTPPLEPEPLEHPRVSSPLRPNLDDELEVHGTAYQRLHLGPGSRADLAHHRAALADEDPLLGLGLHVEQRADGLLPQLLHLDGHGMWNLFAREVERLLADHLGDPLLDGEVGGLLAPEVG